jgi:hypothetical protein
MTLGGSGHQRIPKSTLPRVRRVIAAICEKRRSNLIGITSLAAGADQLFAEAVLRAGGELHVIVPAENYARSFTDRRDVRRYEVLLARATRVETLRFKNPSKRAYLLAGRRVVDLADEVVAVWDGKPARGAGGTGDVARYAIGKGVPLIVVWPKA